MKPARMLHAMQKACGSEFDLLGLSQHMTNSRDLRQRYLELAKVHHPDLGGNAADFKGLQVAYKTLLQSLEQTPAARCSGVPTTRTATPTPTSTIRGVGGCISFTTECPLTFTRLPTIKPGRSETLHGIRKGTMLLGKYGAYRGLVVLVMAHRSASCGVVLNKQWSFSGSFRPGMWTGCGGPVECDTAVTCWMLQGISRKNPPQLIWCTAKRRESTPGM